MGFDLLSGKQDALSTAKTDFQRLPMLANAKRRDAIPLVCSYLYTGYPFQAFSSIRASAFRVSKVDWVLVSGSGCILASKCGSGKDSGSSE